MDMPARKCPTAAFPFLRLPAELRLHVFSFIDKPERVSYFAANDPTSNTFVRKNGWQALQRYWDDDGKTGLLALLGKSWDFNAPIRGFSLALTPHLCELPSAPAIFGSLWKRHFLEISKNDIRALQSHARRMKGVARNFDLYRIHDNSFFVSGQLRPLMSALERWDEVMLPVTTFTNLSLTCRQIREELTRCVMETTRVNFHLRQTQIQRLTAASNIPFASIRRCNFLVLNEQAIDAYILVSQTQVLISALALMPQIDQVRIKIWAEVEDGSFEAELEEIRGDLLDDDRVQKLSRLDVSLDINLSRELYKRNERASNEAPWVKVKAGLHLYDGHREQALWGIDYGIPT